MMSDSQKLLAEYVANHSEGAFRELVGRYIDLVYSTAVRLVDGDTHRAKDVAQTVFADLARKAGQLSPQTMLGGWLHRHTCFVARTVMRGERRRQVRERQAMEMSALDHQPDAALAEIASVLDEVINDLGADDRDAILYRFFEHRNLRSVGEALGTSENVAQKRVARAVQELAMLLRRRGFTLPAAALASGLAAKAVTAAPAGLALSIAATVCGGAGAAAGSGLIAAKAASAANLKLGIIAAITIAGLVTAFLLENQHKAKSADSPVAVQQLPDQPDAEGPPEPELVAVAPAGPAPDAPPQQSSRVPVELLPVAASIPEAVAQPVNATVAVPEIPIAGPGFPAHRTFVAKSGSKMTIRGTANILHTSWLIESPFIGGMLEVGPDFPTEPGQAATPGRVEAKGYVFIRVRSLKSIEEDGRPYSSHMDDIMCRQLKEEQHKQITYALEELILKEVPRSYDAPYVFEARGFLGIAGVTNQTTMTVNILPVGQGQQKKLEITGETLVKTTDYKVSPVDINLVVGHIKTGEEVTLTFKWVVGLRNGSSDTAQKGLVPLLLELPRPAFRGIPVNLPLGPGVEPYPERLRAPMLVPAGLENIAPSAKLTCSDHTVSADNLVRLTDGDKEASDQSILFLRKGTQWVQMDFGRSQDLFALEIWHAHNLPKVYHDVIVEASDDPAFKKNVHTLFNNDQDNTSGRRLGADREYWETFEGKLINAKGARARCLRFYSKGSTESALNEYTEIEVYGRAAR